MSCPDLLLGSVWHTTNPDRFDSIIREGYINPEPNIEESERWGVAEGAEYYPFVRSIGAVSLFDFRGFDSEIYSKKYPNSSWRVFVPCRHDWDSAIWIKIDVSRVGKMFLDGKELVRMWKESNELHRKIMPRIEAAHVGKLPATAFREIYKYERSSSSFVRVVGE